MNNNLVKEILGIIIIIIVSSLIVRFIIWLLPIILIAIVAFLIYKSIKKNKSVEVNKTNRSKNKNIKVIHDLNDED